MHSDRRISITFTGLICILTIIITLLTQLPSVSGTFRPVMFAMWAIAFGVGIIKNRAVIPSKGFVLLFTATVGIVWLECLINYNTHIESYIAQVIPLPLICYLVGALYAKTVSEKTVSDSLITLFAVSLIIFSYIFFTYIGSFDVWLNATKFLYEQKNSVAQIIGCTVIISAFLIKPKSKWLVVGKYLALGFMFLIVIAMQCRTSLIALLITAAAYFVTILKGRKKLAVGIILIIAAVVVLSNDNLSRYVLKAFVWSEKQTRTVDDFTSGRLTVFKEAWDMFIGSPVIGTGHNRVDNMYLCVLSDLGLVGFIPIMALWGTRIVRNLAAFRRRRDSFTTCVFCLTIFYFCVSMAESYPPFGPGVCAFMFWVVCAFVDVREAYNVSPDIAETGLYFEQ